MVSSFRGTLPVYKRPVIRKKAVNGSTFAGKSEMLLSLTSLGRNPKALL